MFTKAHPKLVQALTDAGHPLTPQGFTAYAKALSPLRTVTAVKQLVEQDEFKAMCQPLDPEQLAYVRSLPLDFAVLTKAVLQEVEEDSYDRPAIEDWLSMFHDKVDLTKAWRVLKSVEDFGYERHFLGWLLIPALNTEEWRKKVFAALKADESGYSMALPFYEFAKQIPGADAKACFKAANKSHLEAPGGSDLTDENIEDFERMTGLKWKT